MGCAALQFDQDLDAFKVLKENIIFGGLGEISLQESLRNLYHKRNRGVG